MKPAPPVTSTRPGPGACRVMPPPRLTVRAVARRPVMVALRYGRARARRRQRAAPTAGRGGTSPRRADHGPHRAGAVRDAAGQDARGAQRGPEVRGRAVGGTGRAVAHRRFRTRPQAQPARPSAGRTHRRGAARAGADPLVPVVRRRRGTCATTTTSSAPARSRGCTSCATRPARSAHQGPTSTPRATSTTTPTSSTRASTHWSTSCCPRTGGAPTATRPKSEHAGPRDRAAAVRRLPAALARVRRALGSRRPGRPGPRSPPRRGRVGRRVGRPPAAAAEAAGPRRLPALRDGGGAGERRLRRGGVRRGEPAVHPPRRPAAPLRRRGVARPARPQPGLRPLVVLVQLPRPDGRRREPAAAPPPRRGATRAWTPFPIRRKYGSRRSTSRARRRAAPACSRPTTATGWSTTTSSTTCASWPGMRTSSTSPTGCSTAASSTSSRASPGVPGRCRTRRTTSARGRCSRVTWSAGSGSRSTTSSCSPTTAVSWSGRSTRCSPRWTAAPATGGACRRRRWSSTRTGVGEDASMPLDESPSATWSDRAAGPRWTTCTSARTSRCSGGRSWTTRVSGSGWTPSADNAPSSWSSTSTRSASAAT